MKRISFIIFMLLCTTCTFAQDRVITKNGDVFDAYRVDIGNTFVYYTTEDKDEAALQKIAKSEVLMIKKKDGTKIDITEYVPNSSQNQSTKKENDQQQAITQVKPEDLSPEAKAANDALIAKYNAPVELVIPEKQQKKVGEEEANSAFFCLGVSPNSILTNDDIEICFKIGRLYKINKKSPAEWSESLFSIYRATDNPAIQFSIKNKTNQTIYLDLANTFYVTMGQSVCYYIPSSTTTSNTSGSGAGVNLGSITGALGVGGVAGTLANGVNVGGGSSNTTTNTTYSQRIIAIAPQSTTNLFTQYFFCNEPKKISKGLFYGYTNSAVCLYDYSARINFDAKSQEGPMMFGDHYTYNNESSPVKLSFFVTYDKNEQCTTAKVLSTYFYLSNLFGNIKRNATLSNENIPHFVVKISDFNNDSFPKQ